MSPENTYSLKWDEWRLRQIAPAEYYPQLARQEIGNGLDEMRLNPLPGVGCRSLTSNYLRLANESQPNVLRSSLEASVAEPTAQLKLEGQAHEFLRG